MSHWWTERLQDTRYALRSLAKAPLFTLAAALTLAVGLGSTTAIFSVLDAVVLRPLPFTDPDRLVLVTPTFGGEARGASPGTYLDWHRSSVTTEAVGAYYEVTWTLTGEGPAERLNGARATASYFEVMDAQPVHGRVIQPADDQPDAAPVALLSHRFWQERFAGDEGVLGRTLELNGNAATVIGVLPPAFDLQGNAAPQVYTALALAPGQADNFGGNYLTVMARAEADLPATAVGRELQALLERQPIDAEEGRPGVQVSTLGGYLASQTAPPILILFAAVVAVLLIGCGNVANLLLVRSVARTRELAVRAALGAGRGRIVRQLMTESFVLALIGGALGLGLASWGVTALAAAIPVDLPRLGEAALNVRGVVFSLALLTLSCFVFGLAPALRASRLDLRTAISQGTTGAGKRRDHLRQSFVTLQVALCLVLLVVSGLLLRSAQELARVEPGFATEGVLTADLLLPESDYPDLGRATVSYNRILEEAARLPGAERAALVSSAPLAGFSPSLDFALDGTPIEEGFQSRIRIASPGYLQTIGIPLKFGSFFDETHQAGAPRVVVINETLAKRLDPSGDVVGRYLYSTGYSFKDDAGEPYLWEVIGVAGDVKSTSLRSTPEPAVYLPMAQSPSAPWGWTGRRMVLVLSTERAPSSLAPELRSAVASVDPRAPLSNVTAMSERLRSSMAIERFLTTLLTLLGGIGLFLSAVGIFGLVSYSVSQRREEIGIRLALGATGSSVVGLMVRRGLAPVVLGIVVGVVGGFLAAKALGGSLYGVTATDPMALGGMSALLAAVAFLAAWWPSQRAAQTSPTVVLRRE